MKTCSPQHNVFSLHSSSEESSVPDYSYANVPAIYTHIFNVSSTDYLKCRCTMIIYQERTMFQFYWPF